MTPKLTAIFGPLQGSSFALKEPEMSIGRDPANWLCIGDQLLSRRHCLIKKEGDRLTITDLKSRNGIFVNKIPVKERVLEHGDQIEIGDSLFVFLLQESKEAPSHAVMDDSAVFAQSTTQLRVEDAVYLKPQKHKLSAVSERTARDLQTLLNISTAINSVTDIEIFQKKLLELLFEAIPAERGAIFLADENSEEFTNTYALNKDSKAKVQVSRAIISRVFREGIGILYNDVKSAVHSLLCVPLSEQNKVLGILYLDTSDPTASFDEGHLQFLTAIGAIAAVVLGNARQMQRMIEKNQRLQADLNIEHNMLGQSPSMQKVYQLIAKVAATDATVLICGETGTGKELAARAIHFNSSRADKAFAAINCAALTENLLESELFGHEKGAFTGATAQKKGRLEVAEGGTVFLDEISEIAPASQAKLLRVLQERECERVGGLRPVKLDVRLIAATNRNLEEAIEAGTFRKDLYFRLNVIRITMPPLRDRGEDIPLLAAYFARKYSKTTQRPFREISSSAMNCLMHYDWPGNVRELENIIERAVVLGSSDTLLPEDLPDNLLEAESTSSTGSPNKYHEAINRVKKRLVDEAFEQSGGDYVEAAKILGLHPNYLYRLVKNLKVRSERR